MEGLKFASGMGATMLSGALEAAQQSAREAADRAQQQAREAAERLQNDASATAARMRQQAADAAATCASIDITKMEAPSMQQLRESAGNVGSVLNSTVSSVAARAQWSSPSGVANADAARSSVDDGSSDGDDASWKTSTWGSRLGFGASKSPEKIGLIPKGGGADAAESGRAGLASFTDMGGAALGSLREHANCVGSGLGLVSKPKEPEGRMARLCRCCPNLTYRQRLLGFAVCFIFGGLLSLSALNSLPSLLLGNPAPFAFKYTLGNLLSICSSSLLTGLDKQCRDMLAPERRTASIVYLTSLGATLFSVFVLKWQLLSFVIVIVQFCALTWYMLSYVPYGQTCLKRTLVRLTS